MSSMGRYGAALSKWQQLRAIRAPSMRRGMLAGPGYTDPETVQPCPEGYYREYPDGECIESGYGERIDDVPTPTTPGAVPVREANWDLEHEPYATYRIAAGDTFVGLAATYLGDGGRWREIWDTGGNRGKFPNPDDIRSTGPLDMPHEARDRMIAWLKLGKKGKPGELTTKQIEQANSKAKYWAAAAVGTAAVVALGVAIYAYKD